VNWGPPDPTVLFAVKALVSAPRILRAVDRSGTVQERLEAAVAQGQVDMIQLSYAVCKAIVAAAMEEGT
jgi:hypothetical protein